MNSVQIEIWQLITLFVMYVGGVATAGWLLLGQIDKRMAERFAAMTVANTKMKEDTAKNTEAMRNLERDFLKFRGDLPLEYVRREDFIRNQSVIEAKLDAVALHIQNLQLQRMHNNG